MVSAIWNVKDHNFPLSVPNLHKFRIGIGDYDNWKPPPGNPFEIVVDLGANVGTFALYAVHFHDAKMVYAYEPIPMNLQHLIGSITMNGYWGRIIPMPYAISHIDNGRVGVMKGVSEQQFSLEFKDDVTAVVETNTGSRLMFSPVLVPLQSIEEMLQEYCRIDFLKMDIEGSEWGIFDDLMASHEVSEMFCHKVAHTMIELHPLEDTTYFKGSTGDTNRIQNYLASHGYDVTISDDQWRTIKATRK